MHIPFVDLEAQNEGLREPLEAAAVRVLRSGRYCLGPEVEAFESAFARYCEADHAVAVHSGTAALQLALRACEIGAGDEVTTVALTFVATIAAILYTGAQPVLLDVDPSTWTLDTRAVEAAVTTRTKAIVPVHLHGSPADLDPYWRSQSPISCESSKMRHRRTERATKGNAWAQWAT
jgi:dTDP-4-amino-4,6-dideoxygalactose transaminase